ncbi:nucleoside triphosphate pyrophosphohydrolase [Lacimicrobium alkaliphilum]|uniref:Nucleoside triphosphate pyrophosphohydrolase n=1 Tax=Lacimicrobium alkaliphilum TaxID=1526571 RepID=A0ABQ1QYC6_9ALTE|nr:nucleoside triphosphate pyrophosphohydrolase [Lacimicrobium alkaliphilum]GGD49951.1 nucleoside triphosphate pyrophosphohydrolase [Lacimicrobium alkaliphilum]
MTIINDQNYPNLDKLLWVMDKLRDPDGGCPWDLKQSFKTIVPFTLEEAYEVADAIETGSPEEIREELGDLLFQVVFYAKLGKEQALFDFEDIAGTMAEKLIRRHPHVFGEKTFTEQEVKANWESEKAKERAEKSTGKSSVLDNIPQALPALTRAAKIQKRCANVGFDWPDTQGVFAKIQEEILEVQEELNQPTINQQALEEEIGDLLFATVNLARKLKKDPETLLRAANNKFEGRFRAVEQHFDDSKTPLEQASLEQMEAVWQKVKQSGKAGGQ